MRKNSYRGKFIVFEGLDGSGQSTQAELLKNYFIGQGRSVLLTKEPTQWSWAGKIIKEILDEKVLIEPLKLQKLFCQDRREHLEKEIKPALRSGTMVICDRYFFSTLAFGGLAVPMEKLMKLNEKFIYPDIIFFLKVRPEECLRRINRRGEGIKFFEKLEKLSKVLKNYQEIIKIFDDVAVVNGEESVKEIHQKIVLFLKRRTAL